MQQLVITGSPTRIKRVVEFLEKLDLIEIASTRDAVNDKVNEVFAQSRTETPVKIADNVQAPAPQQAPAAEPTAPVVEGRKRRTKAEIEADNAKAALAPTVADVQKMRNPKSAANEVDFEELKKFVQERALNEDNADKIRTKLAEFGVKKTRDLPKEHHNALWVYLQSLPE